MADIGRLSRARGATPWLTPVTLVRAVIVLSVLVIWQLMAISGLGESRLLLSGPLKPKYSWRNQVMKWPQAMKES